MKVKVGNTIYDGEKEPVMVILTEADKRNIANMLPEATRYCAYPEEWTEDIIEKWMDDFQYPLSDRLG